MPALSPQVRHEGVNGPTSVAVRGPSLTPVGSPRRPMNEPKSISVRAGSGIIFETSNLTSCLKKGRHSHKIKEVYHAHFS